MLLSLILHLHTLLYSHLAYDALRPSCGCCLTCCASPGFLVPDSCQACSWYWCSTSDAQILVRDIQVYTPACRYGTFVTAGSDGAFNFWDKDSKQRLKVLLCLFFLEDHYMCMTATTPLASRTALCMA